MKIFAFLFTGAAALALAACGDTDDTADEGTDVTVVEGDASAPAVTETRVVRDSDDVDSVTVGKDGVSVDVESNGTRVQADDEGGSVTVSD